MFLIFLFVFFFHFFSYFAFKKSWIKEVPRRVEQEVQMECAFRRLVDGVFSPFRPNLTNVYRFCFFCLRSQKASCFVFFFICCRKFDENVVKRTNSEHKCVRADLQKMRRVTKGWGLTFTSAHVLVRAPVDGPGSQATDTEDLHLMPFGHDTTGCVCHHLETGLSPLACA